MKVKGILNKGTDLSQKTIESGYIREAQYSIDIGEIRVVYGIMLLRGCVRYLLSEDAKCAPFWESADFFEVVDPLLPMEWYFSLTVLADDDEYTQGFQKAIWGYKEMALDENHYEDLIEREPEALDIFFKRKKEIDEYEELSKFISKKP